MKKHPIWHSFDIPSGEKPVHLSLGMLHLWMQRRDDELWIASEYREEESEPGSLSNEPPQGEVSWARYATDLKDQNITLQPVTPDKPLVVSPEFPLRIAPHSEVLIYSLVPVWVRIVTEKKGYQFIELAGRKLSRTWFGGPLEGELCYWHSTKARRDLDHVPRKTSMINCPIRIRNKTESDLHFEKICFRVDRLSIFNVNDMLWADETDIEYHGEDQHSDVSMTGKLLKEAGKGTLLMKPRNPQSKSFATRTFKRLFDDTFTSAR